MSRNTKKIFVAEPDSKHHIIKNWYIVPRSSDQYSTRCTSQQISQTFHTASYKI